GRRNGRDRGRDLRGGRLQFARRDRLADRLVLVGGEEAELLVAVGLGVERRVGRGDAAARGERAADQVLRPRLREVVRRGRRVSRRVAVECELREQREHFEGGAAAAGRGRQVRRAAGRGAVERGDERLVAAERSIGGLGVAPAFEGVRQWQVP